LEAGAPFDFFGEHDGRFLDARGGDFGDDDGAREIESEGGQCFAK
jgi:hypothetical protein